MSIPSDNPILLARDLRPSEGDPAAALALALAVGDGEVVALTREAPAWAESDATALLRCLGGADSPACGEVWIKGTALHTLRPAARLRFGHAQCAVLPRTSGLLRELSMVDNTALPLLLAGVGRGEARKRAHLWLERLEASDYADQRTPDVPPLGLRRVAMARALVTDPPILLADEPTLDLTSAERFHLLRIMRAAAGTHDLTILIATDDEAVAGWADRRIRIRAAAVDTSELAAVAEAAAAELAESRRQA